MTKQILFLLLLISVLSINFTLKEVHIKQSRKKNKYAQKLSADIERINDHIRFDFTSEMKNTFEENLVIKATLYNDNTDTVYFLTSSCNGEIYSLRYDTTKFVLTPLINCNASFPRLKKIGPKGKYEFQAQFRCIRTETKIKLGFDFYSVDKTFNSNKITLGDIHNRNEKNQTIIWSNEQTIK